MPSQDAKSDLSLQMCLESPQRTDIFKETIQDMGAIWIHDPGQAAGPPTTQHEVKMHTGKISCSNQLSLFITKLHFYMCVGSIVLYK